MSDVLRDSAGGLRRRLLTMQLDRAHERFALAATCLGDHAELTASLEREPAALKGQCDRHRGRSPSCELAAEISLDKQRVLRLHLPLFSEEATQQSLTVLVAASG